MKADTVNVVYQTDRYRLVCITFQDNGGQAVKIVEVMPVVAHIVPVQVVNELTDSATLQRWNGR